MPIRHYEYLLGKKSNMLTAINIVNIKGKRKQNVNCTMIECRCDCGNLTKIYPYQFEDNSILSCGCLKHRTPYNATHKLSKEKLYHICETIRLKCTSSKSHKYYLYGARGISMCQEWFNDFLAFREWSLSHGYKEGLTIDRIDNDGNYEPSNCRWVDRKTQQRNRRTCKYITYNGETKCLAEWCEELNLVYKTINNRLNKGWSVERAFTTPVKRCK